MLALLECQYAVMEPPRRTAPDDDIAMEERHAQHLVAPAISAELEDRRQAEGHRDHRVAEIPLVPVLMQGEPGPGLIAVDQTGIGNEFRKTRLRGDRPGQLTEQRRHGR